MNNSKPRHDRWDPCHPGIIHEAAKDIVVSRRRMLRGVCGGALVGVIGGGAVLGLMMADEKEVQSSTMPAGIACISVLDHLQKFIAGEIEDEALVKRIGCHIVKCPGCRAKYEKMRRSKSCGSRPTKVTIRPCWEKAPAP